MALDFDLVDIRLFINAAETRSLTHGAERSYLSVPSASTRIKNMEDRLGIKLFYRTRQGIRLTPAGDEFLHHGRLILQQIENLYGNLQQYARGIKGNLRLFASTTSVTLFLPLVLRDYLATHPDVAVDIQERLSQEIVRAVYDGTADIGIVSDAVSTAGLQVFPYHSHRYVVVTSACHPLANCQTIDFEKTLSFDYVGPVEGSVMHRFLKQAADCFHEPIRTRVQVGSFEALCRMVEGNIGIGLLPEPAARQYAETMAIRVLHLTDDWASRTLQICVRDLEALPSFAADLVHRLVADAASASKASAG
jgi:DNA-binding transcriptional LysR family regulator